MPYGIVPELAAKGITGTGSYNPRGGVAVTAAGLIFAGTTGDRYVRAYDSDNGKVLFEKELPGGPDGIPAVYEVNGKQYVVFCVSRGEDAKGYYALALPEK